MPLKTAPLCRVAPDDAVDKQRKKDARARKRERLTGAALDRLTHRCHT
jgi:hypothetical protein